jgi:hypothetical protein
LPPGFPAVPQYFNPVSVGPLLNQLDSPDFTWRTKHLLWDELNVLKRKLNVKTKQGIDDYRFKSCVFYQNVRLWTSGRSLYGWLKIFNFFVFWSCSPSFFSI